MAVLVVWEFYVNESSKVNDFGDFNLHFSFSFNSKQGLYFRS